MNKPIGKYSNSTFSQYHRKVIKIYQREDMRLFTLAAMAFILMSCNSQKTTENQPQSSNPNWKCQNQNKAILNWRTECTDNVNLAMIQMSAKKREKWCSCIETNWNPQAIAESDCSIKPEKPLYISRGEAFQVKCGTIQNPL